MTFDVLRDRRFSLANGAGELPAAGFGTSFTGKDPKVTTQAVIDALTVGFRHIDCAERYRNEEMVGVALSMKFASVVIVALAVAFSAQSVSAQNLKGVAPEWRAGAKTPMIPGRSDADRWHNVKNVIPSIIGMSRADVKGVLGKCTDQHQKEDGKHVWTYQITEYAKNGKPKYLCMLFTVLFENDRAVKCSIEPLWPAAKSQ